MTENIEGIAVFVCMLAFFAVLCMAFICIGFIISMWNISRKDA